MAQIKLLKIGADGFSYENSSTDDITFNSLTILKASGWASNEAVPKSYIDQLTAGIDWQDSVLDKDLTAPPGSPTTGDRYIIETGATGAWATHDGKIAEWNGTSWDFTVPNEGFSTWVEDEDIAYVYNGTAWVKMAGLFNHNDLGGLQGGTTNEYYHLTNAEDAWLSSVVADISAANVADLSDNESVTGDWSFATGQLVLPNSANGTPSAGDIYYSGGVLYIYNGSAYVPVSGDSKLLYQEFTAGAGGIAANDAVYISGDDTILKASASSTATAKAIGIALETKLATETVKVAMGGSIATGVLTGATAGTQYFLSTTAGGLTTTPPTGSGNTVNRIGIAVNATDLLIQIGEIRVRS